MRSKGYAVKGETFGNNALKYLSFSASGQNRFTRISKKNFGVGYTKEAIREKIANRVKTQEYSGIRKRIPFPKKADSKYPDAKRALIDTNKEKFQENSGLKHWANVQNLKIAAASYAERGIVGGLEQKITEKNVMNITYEKCGDYLILNLIPNPEPEGELRKSGLMRKSYLENYRRGIYSGLLLSGELKMHLLMIQGQAETRFDLLVEQMAKSEGVTEQLKAETQMLWVQRMNDIRARAEEIVREKIIYSL